MITSLITGSSFFGSQIGFLDHSYATALFYLVAILNFAAYAIFMLFDYFSTLAMHKIQWFGSQSQSTLKKESAISSGTSSLYQKGKHCFCFRNLRIQVLKKRLDRHRSCRQIGIEGPPEEIFTPSDTFAFSIAEAEAKMRKLTSAIEEIGDREDGSFFGKAVPLRLAVFLLLLLLGLLPAVLYMVQQTDFRHPFSPLLSLVCFIRAVMAIEQYGRQHTEYLIFWGIHLVSKRTTSSPRKTVLLCSVISLLSRVGIAT